MTKQEKERLESLEKEIRQLAKDWGLITKEVTFEVVPAKRMIEGMAYQFPINFSHWSFGRDYDKLRTIYEHTHSYIPYEQVWNFEEPKAFLIETNPFALQALTIAHVYAHVDFFLANRYCQQGRFISNVAEEARQAADRFRQYEEKYGSLEVEKIIDAALSIRWQQHPDPFFVECEEEQSRQYLLNLEYAKRDDLRQRSIKDGQPIPQNELETIEKRIKSLKVKRPPEPVYDLLYYISHHSPKPLEPWMQDVLSVIRNQSRSLAYNMRTKMLNEGWATYWHIRFVRKLFELKLITPEEHEICVYYHTLVTQKHPKDFNWYRLGWALYEDVKERWDQGRFGDEYENCRDAYKLANWDTKANLGTKKIFDIRATYSDRMAVEDLFSDDFIRTQELYIYQRRKSDDAIEDMVIESDPEVVRGILKTYLAFHNIPVISVEDANYDDHGNLYLKHHYDGYDLDHRYRDRTLEKIFYLWGRKVYLETRIGDKNCLVSYDGSKHKIVILK